MIQATSRSSNRSIEYCRIHDVLRDLAMQKAKEDNFFMVYSHPNDKLNILAARRLAIHHPNCHELILNKNLRTLLSFDDGCMLDCSKQRLPKVVKFEGRSISRRKLGMFEGLTQLRYLSLSGNLSAECEKEYMIKVIGSKRFLQTIDFRNLCHEGDPFVKIELPNSAWHQIKTLRHIMTKCSLPAPTAELTNLQTCDEVTIRRSWESMEVPLLPNLRRLRLSNESSSWNAVAALLDTLEHLISLDLVGEHVPTLNILDMRRFPFYQRLQFLLISSTFHETFSEMALPHVSMLPPHLTELYIDNYLFTQDPMPVIEKLACLKHLTLSFECKVRKMRCSAGGFCQLESLWFRFNSLEELEIEDGAMPNLKELTLTGCTKLSVPQGLQHLTNLKYLGWLTDTDKGNEVRSLCKHVPLLILGS